MKTKDKKSSKNNNKNRITLKILTLGDSAVGKSAILIRYTQNKFHSNYLTTVGIDYQSKIIHYQNREIEMQIWDSAGQEKYRAISKQYYKKANGIILLYDVTSRESFQNIKQWIKDKNNNITMKPFLILVGNKIDLERKVTQQEGEELAQKYNVLYFETSAATGKGIEETFQALVENIMRNYDERKKQEESLMLEKITLDGSQENKKCCKI